MNPIRRFALNEEGAVGIEYALIGSLISVALVAGASLIGDEFCALFMGIKNTIQTGVTPVVSVPC